MSGHVTATGRGVGGFSRISLVISLTAAVFIVATPAEALPGVFPDRASLAVSEGSPGTFDSYTLKLLEQPDASVVVTVSPSAQVTVDKASLTFTTANWASTQTVTVSAVNDSVVEGSHSGTISHSATSSDGIYSGIAVASIPVTITDDDFSLSFVQASSSQTEGDSGSTAVNVGVVLETNGQNLGAAESVDVIRTGGTASGSDYSFTSPTTLNFPAGSPDGTVVSATVNVAGDTIDEGNETVILGMQSVSAPGAIVGQATHTITIPANDNQSPMIKALQTLDQAGNPEFQFDTGEAARLRVTFEDEGVADSHAVVIDWGDGTPQTSIAITPVGTRTFERTHRFAAEGFFAISVTISDEGGGSSPGEAYVTVSGPNLGTIGDDTVGLVDPTRGVWRLYNDLGVAVTEFYYGVPGDYPFMGDWDGDGIETPGLYRQSDGYVYLRNSNTQGIADIKFFFGNPGDVPIAGDFNNNGFDTVSIYRPSNQTFYIINKLGSGDQGLGAAEFSYVFGNPGDKPFVGDFDGDGIDTVGLHRESTGLVYFRNSHTQGNADHQFIFGNPGDQLVSGDWWTVDGIDTPALYRSSDQTFYTRFTNTQGTADATFNAGVSGWIAVAGVTGA